MSSSQQQQQQQQQDNGNQNETSESPQPALDHDRLVRHIMVIGFHHKHGYQVDYCYPPLTPDGPTFTTPNRPIMLPNCWKTLPLLCLPDGAHNHDSDTIYFTMPDIDEQGSTTSGETTTMSEGIKTIFGTACYRQIHVEKLLNRTDDMTRVAVQKSVCVLSTQPLFGLIRSKLEMITHAYFEELDFSKVRILKLTYENLNSLLSRESVRENATFLGLSARHLVSQFGNNMLVLFKAMLLEKKILFYKSPVRDLCSTIMSMCSLFNGLLECGGLNYSTCDLQLSSNHLEALKLEPRTPTDDDNLGENCDQRREGRVFFSPAKEQVVMVMRDEPDGSDVDNKDGEQSSSSAENDLKNKLAILDRELEQAAASEQEESKKVSENERLRAADSGKQKGDTVVEYEGGPLSSCLMDETIIEDQYAHKLCQLEPEDCGLPLQIFTRGSFCLPYLSISYLDLLSDTRVRSFVIGATNFLFKQRAEMYDVIVDMEENTITISDSALKQCLNLTIEDLRFMDYLQKHVLGDLSSGGRGSSSFVNPETAFDPIHHDVTKWLGGDEWIRYHFKIYTLYLLKAAKTSSQCLDTFNAKFVRAWKFNTNNYRIWDATGKASILNELQSRHPFSSATRGINFSDMKLKLSYAVNSSEKGRMVNQTLNGIGKWSIWNNIASAGNMAASTVSTLATGASTSGRTTTTTTAAASSSSTGRHQSSSSSVVTTTPQTTQDITRKQ